MIKDVLAFIGALSLAGIIGCLVAALWYELQEWIDRMKRNYRIKHRFDKSPTASCYCVDCKHHNNETGRCYRFGETTKEYRCTADNWFCWEATPREE